MNIEQATIIANRLYKGNFRMFGIGNFDITINEFANAIMIANNKTIEDVNVYYEEIKEMVM